MNEEIDKYISKKQYYLLYTLIFFIMIILVFCLFIISNKSFVWKDDGLKQHYRALIYYGQWLRNIIKNLIFNHVLDISTYSFSIGYGSDIISTLQYYVIGDPLNLLSVLIPTKYMAYFYSILILVRFYLSGITFSIFCWYKKDKYDYKQISILVGSFVYIFCGYALFAGVRHPYFMNPMIYYPLVLLGVEKILDKKSGLLFILSVWLSAMSNFYFFYMIAILTAIYVIWRLFKIYTKNNFKEGLLVLGKITLYAFLGTCMAFVLLLPAMMGLLNSARSDVAYTYSTFYSLSNYKSMLRLFLSPKTGHDWTCMGYGAIALISVIVLLMQKQYKPLKIAFIVLTIMSLIPMVGCIMNGFSYVSNRWLWGYSFLIAFIIVVKWNDLFHLNKKEIVLLLGCLSIYTILCFIFTETRTIDVVFSLCIGFVVVLCILFTRRFHIHCGQLLVIGCVLINIFGNSLYKYSSYVEEFVNYNDILDKLENDDESYLSSLDDDAFYRYTGSKTTNNGTLYTGLHSTQYYWSLENSTITQFREELGLSDNILISSYKTLDSSTILSTLANVKYYVQEDGIPYGYTYIDNNIWENDNTLPFGYTYSNCISRETYNHLSSIEKQQALLQGCVIDEDTDNETELTFTNQSIDYDISCDEGISIENNVIKVTKENASITLNFDGLEECETYLAINGLNYDGTNEKIKITMNSTNTNDETIQKTLNYVTPYYQWYSNRDSFMIRFGYDTYAKKSITITFDTLGEYSFDSIEIQCLPMNNYEEQVSNLQQDTLENVDFHTNSVNATNKVTGNISLNESKYLLLTIPYSKGWSAYVDGEKQELLQANTMYSALYLDAGKHEIVLTYETPGLKYGAIISAISLVIVVGVLYVEKKKYHDCIWERK
ncbi:MAG: YfhO family protein [Erysipelotrichaceae bacterium]|nr:YfhO family protein [Erysipelotrichaceae bacterium]